MKIFNLLSDYLCGKRTFLNMASSTPLKDLAESFFQCRLCFDTFQEPKQLPCLHRYCTNCLSDAIKASDDGAIMCPLCKQEFPIPENGVNGIKTDFHMKYLLDFRQLTLSFENKDLKKCVSCLQQKQIATYCFKCRDFLCDKCCKDHINSKMFTEHMPHILKLDSMEAKNLTLDNLSALTDNPRCYLHGQKSTQLCCSSCKNLPVCVKCAYDGHKGHDVQVVTEIAKREKALLQSMLADLKLKESKLSKIRSATIQLDTNGKTEKLVNQYKKKLENTNDKLVARKHLREKGLTNIEMSRKNEDNQTDLKFNEELRQLKKSTTKSEMELKQNMTRNPQYL